MNFSRPRWLGTVLITCSILSMGQVRAADDLSAQYGTRHAYQTFGYSTSVRKRYQSLATYAAGVLEQERTAPMFAPPQQRARVVAPKTGRHAYQTHYRNSVPETGTRRAYQT